MIRIKKQLKHQFDWIIGIAKGGIIPSLYLSYLTDFPLDTLCMSHYIGETKRDEKVILEKNYSHITHKKILLVDDLVDSGDTFHDAVIYLKKFNPALIETAVIYKKKEAKFTPDYFIYETPQDLWIDFSWENPDIYSQVEGILRNPSV